MKEKASEINLPGFSAEASVYKRSSDYFSTGFTDSHAGTVAPASAAACWEYWAECALGIGLSCVLLAGCVAGYE